VASTSGKNYAEMLEKAHEVKAVFFFLFHNPLLP
jgi:hypothetical protein